MKRIILVCLAFILLVGMSILRWMPVQSAQPVLEPVTNRLKLSGQNQDHGWQVCFVGGMINIPGVGERQQIELCHSDGWRINTYCLDPGQPVPVVGSFCSRIEPGSNEFWCGDGVQSILQFAILQTPSVEDTPTPTVTNTNTSTPTPTFTTTLTLLPQIEESVTPTPELTLTLLPQIEESITPFPSSTAYYRPEAGGPGNREVGFGLISIAMLAVGGGWWFMRSRPRTGL